MSWTILKYELSALKIWIKFRNKTCKLDTYKRERAQNIMFIQRLYHVTTIQREPIHNVSLKIPNVDSQWCLSNATNKLI